MKKKIPTTNSEELKEKYAPNARLAPWPPRLTRESLLEALEEQKAEDLRLAPKTVQVFPVGD
jgi:hypothetical protein